MKKIVVDIDYTISKKIDSYENAVPNIKMINKLVQYKSSGFYICLYSARNMRTYGGDLEKIMENTHPILIEWLEKNNVPYDELILGKPWNDEGFYIDDNAIRPNEFLDKTFEEIKSFLDLEREKLWK